MKLLLLLSLLALNASAQDKNNPVVAEVNGVKILKSELDAAFEQSLLYPSNKKITIENTLNYLISRRLSIDEAKKEKLDKDPFVIEKMEDVLHQALISKNITASLEEISVSDVEIKKYYTENPEYRTSHILYRLRAIPSADEVKTGLITAKTIYDMAKKNPNSFDDLAKKHSQTANSASGSDLGYLPSTSLAPEYYAAIKGKPVGFISEPIRTQFGLHIIKVTGIKSFENIDKALYTKIIFDIKRDKAIEDYYAKLKKSAKVKIYKENL